MAFSCQFGKYLRYLFTTQLKRLKVNESSLNSYHQQSLRITARRNLRWKDHQSNVRPAWASRAIWTRKRNFWHWWSAFMQISSVTQSRENDQNICYQKWLMGKSSWLHQTKITAVRLSKIQNRQVLDNFTKLSLEFFNGLRWKIMCTRQINWPVVYENENAIKLFGRQIYKWNTFLGSPICVAIVFGGIVKRLNL